MKRLWTDPCLAFLPLEALQEEPRAVCIVDAVGGTSLAAQKTALSYIDQVDWKLISRV